MKQKQKQVSISIAAAHKRGGDALVAALLATGIRRGDHIQIAADGLTELARYRHVRAATPFERWPLWARIASRFRTPGDRGIGDTIEHWQGVFGGGARLTYRAFPDGHGWWEADQLHFWYWCVFGCKVCPKCPQVWNARFPYGEKQFK